MQIGEQRLYQRLLRPRYVIPCLLLGLVLVHLPLVEAILQNGDAAVYNEQVETLNLSVRPTHFGYIVLGILFTAVLPGGTDWAMNLMTVLLGIGGLLAVCLTTWRYTASWFASALAAAVVLAIPVYVKGMVLSEVDVPLTAAIATSWCLFVYKRRILAGVVFGWSMMISPLACLTLPVFLFGFTIERKHVRRDLAAHVKPILLFAVAGLMVYLSLVLLNWDSYWYGGRGIFGAPHTAFSFSGQLRRSGSLLVRQNLTLVPLLTLGFFACLSRDFLRKHGGLALGLLVSVIAACLLGERVGSVPVQLPNLVLAAPLVGVLVAQPLHRWQRGPLIGLSITALLIGIGSAYYQAHQRVRQHTSQKERFLIIKERSMPHPAVWAGATGWSDARLFERFVQHRTYKPRSGLTLREFHRHCRRIAVRKPLPAVWFPGRTRPTRVCLELRQRTRLHRRFIGKRTYWVLVPKAPVTLEQDGQR